MCAPSLNERLRHHRGNSEQISSCDNKTVPVVGWGLYRNCLLERFCFQVGILADSFYLLIFIKF